MAANILIATTSRWFSTARLAIAFAKRSCRVDVVCPAHHPIRSTHAVHHRMHFNALSPLRSLRAAILSSGPDLVVPCDDLMVKHLHNLYAAAAHSGNRIDHALCRLLKLSMGDPASYAITESRGKLMELVREEGILAPETKTVTSLQELEQWLARYGFPVMLKADGSSGGEGIKAVDNLEDAFRAYCVLRGAPGCVSVMKQTLLHRNWNLVKPWLERASRQVCIQSFVPGREANLAVACWQGEVLAAIGVDVLQAAENGGPATIVRLLEHDGMVHAARKIVQRLQFSGLCGFDFVLDQPSGAAYLIEMNARVTQTCPLPLGAGRDLIGSICSILEGEHLPSWSVKINGDSIALFPQAWRADKSNELFRSSYHDVPWEAPALVIRGIKHSQKKPWADRIRRLL